MGSGAVEQGVYVKKVSVLPRPITPSMFSDRIQSVDNATSAAIYHALQGAHLLDLHDMLVQDPRYVCSTHSPQLEEARVVGYLAILNLLVPGLPQYT